MELPLVAIEIGGSKLQICTGDATGRVATRARYVVDRTEGAAGIRRQIEQALLELRRTTELAGVGVGYGGPVDWKTGRIQCSHHIEGWSEFPLGDWLGGLAKAPVSVDNDANVAALGEARQGAAVGFNPSFYVTLGSGVGGGLVTDGKIYHGAAPGEAEIGHVRLDRNGTIVEARCAGWSVDAAVRVAIAANPHGFLAGHAPARPGGEAALLGPALEADDADAARILFDTADDLAFALSHVSQLFHPEIITLGGGLSLLGEPLRAAVESAIGRYIMKAHGRGPKIALARLREDAVPVGALILAGDQKSIRM